MVAWDLWVCGVTVDHGQASDWGCCPWESREAKKNPGVVPVLIILSGARFLSHGGNSRINLSQVFKFWNTYMIIYLEMKLKSERQVHWYKPSKCGLKVRFYLLNDLVFEAVCVLYLQELSVTHVPPPQCPPSPVGDAEETVLCNCLERRPSHGV